MTHPNSSCQPIAWLLNNTCKRLSLSGKMPTMCLDTTYLQVIAFAMEQICSDTENRLLDSPLSDLNKEFAGCKYPSISIDDYISDRLFKYMEPTVDEMIRSMILIDHLITVCEPQGLVITWRTVHRLFATALIITLKFTHDLCYKNKHYAKIIGISNYELNKLEQIFLSHIKFAVWLKQDEVDYYTEMISCLAYKMEEGRACPTVPTVPTTVP